MPTLSLRDLLHVRVWRMTTIGLSARPSCCATAARGWSGSFGAASLGAVLQNLLGVAMKRGLGDGVRLGIAYRLGIARGRAGDIARLRCDVREDGRGGLRLRWPLASATFGITVAGLLGGYVGGWLIRRHRLKTPMGAGVNLQPTGASAGSLAHGGARHRGVDGGGQPGRSSRIQSSRRDSAGLPSARSSSGRGTSRNLDDRYGFARIAQAEVDTAHGRIATSTLFIVMALLTLRLWELAHLALPPIDDAGGAR